MFYDDDLGTENIFFPVCLISEYASFTINVYLYSIHLGIWNVTAVFQFPFKITGDCRTEKFEMLNDFNCPAIDYKRQGGEKISFS